MWRRARRGTSYWRGRGRNGLSTLLNGVRSVPLKDAAANLAAAEQSLAEATRAHREFEGAVAELERLRLELERHQEDRRRTGAKLEEARRAADEASRLQSALQAQRGQVGVLEEQLAAARREAELRREKEQALARAGAEVARLEQELATLEGYSAEQSVAQRAAEDAVRKTQEELRAAAADLRRARQQRRRGDAELRRGELQQRCDRVRAAAARAEQAAECVAGLRVDALGVADLRKLQHRLETTQAQVLGAATRVRLRARRELVVDGEVMGPGEERTWSCSDAVRIAIAEVGELEIVPGGEDLGRLRAAADDLVEQCRERRAAMAVESLEAAELLLRDRELLQQEQAGAERLLEELCPEGREALTAALAVAVGERRALGDEDADALEEAVAEACHATLEALVEEQRGAVEVYHRSQAEAQTRLAASRARVQGLREVAADLETQLDAATDREALDAAVAVVEGAWQQALATAKGLEARLSELGGDGVRATVERLQRAQEGLRTEADQMNRRRTELETTLDILAGQNLHEVEQDAVAQRVSALGEQRRVERRAAAARTLADTLEACRADSQARLLAPAVAAVGKHLRPLFPAARVSLAEDLSVEGLQTEVRSEPLTDLSGGTREQVGVAVRLGLAELLAGGERLPLVLDDALTNTDFRRIEQLHQILFAAAADLQILLFSCHPEVFAGLGAGQRYRLPSRQPR